MSQDTNVPSEELEEKIKASAGLADAIVQEMGKRIVGNLDIGRRLLMAIICQGHVLLEGLPGLAKTTSIKALADVSKMAFKRVQFTPDLLPADIIGTQIYNPKTSEFLVRKGPIFTNLLLADEINRAPAKVQSALLEAMQEKQVTIGNDTFKLDRPFLVMATQNPVDQEGTYPLPEAQVDRFLFKLIVGYATPDEEVEIIKRVSAGHEAEVNQIISPEQIIEWRNTVNQIHVSDKIRQYIVDLVFATREPEKRGLEKLSKFIEYGASPRAAIALDQVARVNAFLEGRAFVIPQDVKDIGLDILRHRVKISYEAEAEDIKPENIVAEIFANVKVP